MAQTDFFLKIDGVPGESTDDKHKAEIEIESFSWGATNQGTAGHGGGSGTGKVVPHDIQISKRMDKSSPVLFIACATGQHYKEALLTARKSGTGGQADYLKIKLEDVTVTSYQTSASNGAVVYENIGLQYAKLEMVYKEQKADGTLGGEVKQKYDFAANKKV